MTHRLNKAYWEYSNQQAKLVNNGNTLIEISFSQKAARVKIGSRQIAIMQEGSWCPKMVIKENNLIIGLQKQTGFWTVKTEWELDNKTFLTRTVLGKFFNVTFTFNGIDILTYKLETLKSRPQISFEIHCYDLPESHLMLLMALGFCTIKNVAIESMSDDFILMAIA